MCPTALARRNSEVSPYESQRGPYIIPDPEGIRHLRGWHRRALLNGRTPDAARRYWMISMS